MTAFSPPPKDDDHFSPEADAAMSEMTGNTALLAQVCGGDRWWGRLHRIYQESHPSHSVRCLGFLGMNLLFYFVCPGV
jgi:hypothetical protein